MSEFGFVYRYLLNKETVYVGQTKNLDTRINQHAQETRFYGLTNVEFKMCLAKNLNDIEAYFINLYKPVLNQRCATIKNPDIEKIINVLPKWEVYKKPIKVVLPLVQPDTKQMAYEHVRSSKPCGEIHYGFGLPIDTNTFPTEIEYYNFGKGKSKIEFVLLEDYNKQMELIRKNFCSEVERVANEILKEHSNAKEITIQK